MAKGKRARGGKKRAGPSRDRRAERLEKALAAGLRREAKAASRLEAAQLEVAVLRAALAEVLAEAPAEEPPAPAEAPPARAANAGPASPEAARTRRAPRRPPADR